MSADAYEGLLALVRRAHGPMPDIKDEQYFGAARDRDEARRQLAKIAGGEHVTIGDLLSLLFKPPEGGG